MKKLLTLFSFIFFVLTNLVYGTAPSMTNVSATLTDSSTQIWTNGSWQATFQTPFGNPNTPSNNGNPVIQQYSGFLDGSGHFTVSLDDNNVVTPAGSHWVFTLCPNATVPVCSNATILVTGVSQDLSVTLSNALTLPVVNTKPTIFRAYNDTEAFGGLGALYVRTNDNSLRLCNTPAGCPGSGWTAASVPSNNPTFTGTVQINGNLNVTGLATFSNCINFSVSILDFTHVCPQAGGPFNINLPAASGTLLTDTTLFPLFAPNGDVTHPQYSWSSEHGLGFYRDGNTVLNIAASSRSAFSFQDGVFYLPSDGGLCQSSTTDAGDDCPNSLLFNTGQNRWELGDTAGLATLAISNLRLTASTPGLATIDWQSTPNYLIFAPEITTPTTPVSTFEKFYFKATKGDCTVDSAGNERCSQKTGTSPITVTLDTIACPTCLTSSTAQAIKTFHFNTCSNSGATTDTCAVGAQALPATQPDTNYELVCSFDSGPNTGGFCTNSNGGNPCPGSISIYNKTTTTFGYALTTTRGVTGSEFGVAMCHIGHS